MAMVGDGRGAGGGLPEQVIDTGHSDMIHDAQLDYYAKRLATCSSDRSIKIFEVDAAGDRKLEAELMGHDGPVWQVCWGHPKFGNVLASCGFDRRVIVWREVEPRVWRKMYEYVWHASSVNAVAFAPAEYGLILACASSDGFVSVCAQNPDGTWNEQRISGSLDAATFSPTHAMGANSVSWAPAINPSALWNPAQATPPPKTLVTGGCDNLVCIWTYNDSASRWERVGEPLQKHTDWVRSVAWAPSLGLASSTIASAGQDKRVVLWTRDDTATSWKSVELPLFDAPVWSLSWTLTGNVLGVASGDDSISLWKEQLDGSWKNITEVVQT